MKTPYNVFSGISGKGFYFVFVAICLVGPLPILFGSGTPVPIKVGPVQQPLKQQPMLRLRNQEGACKVTLEPGPDFSCEGLTSETMHCGGIVIHFNPDCMEIHV